MERLVNDSRILQDCNMKRRGKAEAMISFLEMVQRYPIGAKVSLPENGRENGKEEEIVGYEYYNGTGFLVFADQERVNVDQLLGEKREKLY